MDNNFNMINDNLVDVQERINSAVSGSNREASEVTLIAVSKTKPVEDLMVVYEAGVRDFGENKVQELCDKYEQLPKDINWHMIGHLQTNKVKYIVDKVKLIHSVDSLRLASVIDHEAEKKNVVVDILIEVNVAGEESKFGVSSDEVEALAVDIAEYKHIRLRGLMTIAPYTENPDENRKYFAKLKQLLVDINAKNNDNISMDILSMGMTGDYEVAIEEGATLVRVGTGIFGNRIYK